MLLVIEVADSSLEIDRQIKAPFYAGAAIPQYWIINLADQVIEVYEQPHGPAYQHTRTMKSSDHLMVPGVAHATLVADWLV